jgi:hypothetical protein
VLDDGKFVEDLGGSWSFAWVFGDSASSKRFRATEKYARTLMTGDALVAFANRLSGLLCLGKVLLLTALFHH